MHELTLGAMSERQPRLSQSETRISLGAPCSVVRERAREMRGKVGNTDGVRGPSRMRVGNGERPRMYASAHKGHVSAKPV